MNTIANDNLTASAAFGFEPSAPDADSVCAAEIAPLAAATAGDAAKNSAPGIGSSRAKTFQSAGFVRAYARQGGRCHWCGAFTLPQNLTREHLFPRRNGQRSRFGGAWVLAHEQCNRSRGALTIGSLRFDKWLRRVLWRNDIRPFERRDKMKFFGCRDVN